MSPNAILEFILGLLRDREAAVRYRSNPGRALCAAGLGAVTPEDLAAVAPMVAESALVCGGDQLAAIVAAGGLGTGAGAGVNLSDVADSTAHSAVEVGGAPGASVTDTASAAANPWMSVDVSHAFGNGLGAAVGTGADGTLGDTTHSAIDSTLSAGANGSRGGGLATCE